MIEGRYLVDGAQLVITRRYTGVRGHQRNGIGHANAAPTDGVKGTPLVALKGGFLLEPAARPIAGDDPGRASITLLSTCLTQLTNRPCCRQHEAMVTRLDFSRPVAASILRLCPASLSYRKALVPDPGSITDSFDRGNA